MTSFWFYLTPGGLERAPVYTNFQIPLVEVKDLLGLPWKLDLRPMVEHL